MDDDYFSEENATFGDRVAAARDTLGYTQGELARRIGVKVETLRAWEADQSEPRANKLQMLAGLLNVSMGWLLSGVGEGGVAPPDESAEAVAAVEGEALAELREIRVAQLRLAERLGRLERRLRTAPRSAG